MMKSQLLENVDKKELPDYFRFDQQEILKEYRKNGWKMIGHFCSYTPEELFYSNKLLPVRIFPKFAGNFELADKYFPAYTCSFARSSLNALLSNEFDSFDGFFISSNCDTLRHLLHHFIKKYPTRFIPDLIIPSKVYSKQSEEMLLSELLRLEKNIQRIFEPRNGDSLGSVVNVYRENRMLLKMITELRIRRPGVISGRAMNEIYHFNMWIDKETANTKMREFLAEVKCENSQIPDKPKVFILGNCCGNNDIIDLIEDCGCYVVNDLLSSGNKYFQDVPERSTPMETIASRLNEKITCPTKIITYSADRHQALNQIKEMIKESRVDGIILLNQKFCDPHGLDRPWMLPGLKEIGPRILELESEQDINNSGQIKTRVEAFIEMIS